MSLHLRSHFLVLGWSPSHGDRRTSTDGQGACSVSLTTSQDVSTHFTGGETEATWGLAVGLKLHKRQAGPQDPGSSLVPCVGRGLPTME